MLLETFFPKFLPLLFLAWVLIAAITFFGLQDQRYTEPVPNLVEQHRDVVGVIVQILANGLSILQMLVLCSLINFTTRIRLFRTPASLPDLGFWSALSTPRLDTSLPWTRLLIVGLIVSLGPIFGAIWSGSLTPIATTAVASGGKIAIPIYPAGVDATFSLQEDGLIQLDCKRPANLYLYNPSVLDMTTCPALDLASALIASARTATSLHGPTLHTKLDNNDWTYIGRSYGVGSSQGLFEPTRLDQQRATGYSYMETGYSANISCQRTTLDPLNFQLFRTETSDVLAYADTMIVASENISIPAYQLYTQDEAQPFFTWATCSNCSASGDHVMVTYSYGDWYAGFGSHFCSVTFQPTTFNVTVSVTNSTIIVHSTAEKAMFDSNRALAQIVVADLDLLSRTSSNIGISTLGTAISYNAMTINATQSSLTTTRLNELALENFVASLVDDLLVARATEQMIIYQNHTDVDVQAVFPAIVIGTSPFHHAQLVVCIVLAIVYSIQALRTGFWAELPRFNFVETATLAAAALSERNVPRTVQLATSYTSARVSASYSRDGNPRMQFEDAELARELDSRTISTKGPYTSLRGIDVL